MGIQGDSCGPMCLVIFLAIRRQRRDRIGNCADTASGDFAIVNPGAGWGAKRWPAERYGEVASGLAGLGIRSILNYGPGRRGNVTRGRDASWRNSSGHELHDLGIDRVDAARAAFHWRRYRAAASGGGACEFRWSRFTGRQIPRATGHMGRAASCCAIRRALRRMRDVRRRMRGCWGLAVTRW